MKYRSRTDIIRDILEAANGGSTKTRIMYKAFLSYAQLKEYLGVLSESGLIQYSQVEMTFSVTPKGVQFLKAYEQMSELSEQFREQSITTK